MTQLSKAISGETKYACLNQPAAALQTSLTSLLLTKQAYQQISKASLDSA